MPGQRFDTIVHGGTCYTPGGVLPSDIGIRNGRVAALGHLDLAHASDVLDAKGLTVLPGVIDTHVHFREPGSAHKEDMESGTRSAVLGGVTAVFEMPNTSPPTTTVGALRRKLDAAAGRAWCDYAFYAGATAANSSELSALERLPGCCGIKLYMGSSTGGLLVSEDEDILRALQSGSRRISVHCEDEPRLTERRRLAEESADPAAHPVWRDEEAAWRAAERLLKLGRQAGRRLHIVHVTTAEEIDRLAEHKDIATFEVTPQHLTLAAPDCYRRLGTFAQMNPPIRDSRHRDALWRAVKDGLVDVIGSDHAPHTREEKAKPYPESPSGLPGVQTLLAVLLNHIHAGRLSIERLVDLTSAGPARVFQIARKGRIATGYDADLTLIDLHARRTITNDLIASRCGWTPFDGLEVTGWPIATIVRGQLVMRDAQVIEPNGQPIQFQETLARTEGGESG